MPEHMLQFVNTPQQTPEKRAVVERRHDFQEIYRIFQDREAASQASRCSQCGVPFCQMHCPLHNNIPDWLKLTAEGRLEEAYERRLRHQQLPRDLRPHLPAGPAVRGQLRHREGLRARSPSARSRRYITDTAFEQGWVKPITPRRERAQSVGIIGAGPAGLAAAEQLRRTGYQVHVYDRYDRVGGLLIYGIPNFKLEKDIVLRRAAAAGRRRHPFQLELRGRRATSRFAELRARHDAVLIATGVYKARDIGGPGVGPARHRAGARLSDRLATARASATTVPDFDSGALERRGQARRGDRRRRHGDGLRAHGGAPGRGHR